MNKLLVLAGGAMVLLAFLIWDSGQQPTEPVDAAAELSLPATPTRDTAPPHNAGRGQLDAAESQEAEGTTFGESRAPASEAVAGPPLLPIFLPGEFNWLSTNSAFLDFEHQGVDPAWSGEAERQITQFLTDNPEITARFGRPIVHCRTSACKVFVTSYGREERALRETFRERLADYADQPWANQFIGSVETRAENGIETLVWTLQRIRRRDSDQ